MTTPEQIEYILDRFDFDRVHRAMVALNWVWAGENGVPEVYRLREKARELLRDVEKSYTLSTGGFYATQDEDGTLGLSFRIDDWRVTPEGKCE